MRSVLFSRGNSQVDLQRCRLAGLLDMPRLLQHWRASRKSRATAACGGRIRGGGSALVCARSALDVLKRGHGVRVGGVPGMHGGATAVRCAECCAECCHGSRARGEPQSCAVQHARRCLGGHALDRRAVQGARGAHAGQGGVRGGSRHGHGARRPDGGGRACGCAWSPL